jgi:hypothetical protein
VRKLRFASKMVCSCCRSAARRPARVWSESLPMRLATRNRMLRLCVREECTRAKGTDVALTYHVGNVSCLLRSVLRMLREVDSCCRRCRNWSSARMFSAGSAMVLTRCSSREICSRVHKGMGGRECELGALSARSL